MDNRGSSRRRGDQKAIWRNYSWKVPKSKEESRYPGRGNTEGPKKINPNRPTPRHTIIKMAKFKDKEDSKGSKRKPKTQLQGNSHKAITWFLHRNFAGQEGVAWYFQSHEKENSAT